LVKNNQREWPLTCSIQSIVNVIYLYLMSDKHENNIMYFQKEFFKYLDPKSEVGRNTHISKPASFAEEKVDDIANIERGKYYLKSTRGDSDILDQKLILTTIVEDSHFYLLIIVNPSLIKEVSTIIAS
jgi:hypothetical protein